VLNVMINRDRTSKGKNR